MPTMTRFHMNQSPEKKLKVLLDEGRCHAREWDE